ncbi:MAG: hypothetical protein ACOY4K_08320 [Pseudomonadota bacterium]
MASFSALARAIAAETAGQARFTTGRLEIGEAFAWTIGLLAAGAAALVVLSLAGGAPGLGVALAARLVFVLILMLAALPWLSRGPTRLDPLDLPADLLPRV